LQGPREEAPFSHTGPLPVLFQYRGDERQAPEREDRMQEKYVVEKSTLEGTVRASGAKNSALKLMAAALMGGGPSTIHNVPDIADVRTMLELLDYMGFSTSFAGGTVTVGPAVNPKTEAPYYLVQRMRASVDVLGALSARFGRARVAMPGGCNIGARQIDLHLKGLAQMGADLQVSHGYVEVESNGLTGSHIYLEFASVGATENLLMAACMAKGPSVLENVAKEPEIADLAVFLNEMGARIEGIGSSTLSVDGMSELSGAEHSVMGDRIEAGTYLIAGAATGGAVKVEGVDPSTLEMLSMKMLEAGCEIESGEEGGGWMRASSNGRPAGIEISTLPYPGFATDLQPQMLALLSIGEGTSFITENIFDNRFMVVDELNRLGTDITTKGHHAIVRGVEALSSAPVTSTDLRAGAALCIAGMLADGATEVYEIQHVDRGYERFEEKLSSLGAKIRREPVGA